MSDQELEALIDAAEVRTHVHRFVRITGLKGRWWRCTSGCNLCQMIH